MINKCVGALDTLNGASGGLQARNSNCVTNRAWKAVSLLNNSHPSYKK